MINTERINPQTASIILSIELLQEATQSLEHRCCMPIKYLVYTPYPNCPSSRRAHQARSELELRLDETYVVGGQLNGLIVERLVGIHRWSL
jgi:hypothetical protein